MNAIAADTAPTEVPSWERIDTGPLSWVMSELRSSLERSLESLRTFSKNPEDLTALRLARADLHQAHGALQLVDLEGVSLVTEEVEHMLEGFESAPEEANESAITAVEGAFRAVTQYLEELLEGAPHQPIRLFPSYRALLALRGADRIHPADLFFPNLSIRPPRPTTEATTLSPEEIGAERASFERALLLFLRDDKNRAAAHDMQSAVARIESSPKQGQQRAFWWVTRAFFDALAADALPADLNVKRLAARINLQIRRLLEGSGMVAERLLRDTLFFVARSTSATPHIFEVKRVYGLTNSLPDDFEEERFSELNLAQVRSAKEALTSAKTAWSHVVAGDPSQISGFARDASALLGAVGSLSRRGLADVAQVVASIGTELTFDPRKPAEGVGLDVATALLFLEGALEQVRSLDDQFDIRAQAVVARVESSALGVVVQDADTQWLDEISRQAQERLTMTSFVGEMQTNLRSIEKILDGYFRDPTQTGELALAERQLGQIGGALSVLGHEQAGAAIKAGQETIRRFAEPDYQPAEGEFERVAESLGAVGFYIESLQHRADSGAMFHFDEETGTFTADLKRPAPPAAEQAEDPDPDPKTPGPGGSASHTGPEGLARERSVEENAAQHGDVAAELMRSYWHDPEDEETKAGLVSALQQVKQDAMLLDDSALKDKASQALKLLSEGTSEGLEATIADVASQANRRAGHELAKATPPSLSAPIPIADTAVDAELLEIFLMEAGEVLENSRAASEQLKKDSADREALTTARRAYHTLKGSGRMVGLTAFGEAAWAIEQTLNQWLAEGRSAAPELIGLLDDANQELGAWADELSADGHSARQADRLVAAASAVRERGAEAKPVLESAALAAAVIPERLPDAPPDSEIKDYDGRSTQGFLATEVVGDDPPEPVELMFEPHGSHAPANFVRTADEHQWMATELTGDAAQKDAEPTPIAESGEEDLDFPLFEESTAETPLADQPAEEKPVAPVVAETEEFDTFAATEPFVGAVEEINMTLPTELAGEDIFDSAVEADAAPSTDGPAPEAPAGDDEMTKTYVMGGEVDYSFEIPPVTPPPPPRATVLPFALATNARSDEYKQIGPLTISVPLYNIYLSEADELLRVLTLDFSEWRHELVRHVSEASLRAAHSLAGTSSTVGLNVVHDLAYALESVLQTLHRQPVPIDASEVGVLEGGVDALRAMLHQFAAETMPQPDVEGMSRLFMLRDELRARHDPAQHPTPAMDSLITTWVDADHGTVFGAPPEPAVSLSAMQIANLAAAEKEAMVETGDEIAAEGTAPIASQAEDVQMEPNLEFPVEHVEPSEPAEPAAHAEHEVHVDHTEHAEHAEQTEHPEPVSEEVHAGDAVADVVATENAAPSAPAAETPPAESVHVTPAFMPMAPERAPLPLAAAIRSSERVRDEIDAELIEVFLQEASEYMPQISENLRSWQSQPTDMAFPHALMRLMHTVKGSARMAGAMRLGEVVHEMETRVESGITLREIPPGTFEELLAMHDRATELYDALMRPSEVPHEPAEKAEEISQDALAEPSVVEESGAPAGAAALAAPGPGTGVIAARGVAPQTTPGQVVQAVRVRADVLDRLVNQAGEVSISRSRLENEVSQIRTSLGDLTDNLARLRAQLREIEIQAETQMQSQLSMVKERERFDPLEFDRFTRLQELTRMMAESVSDVGTVQQNMVRSLDGATRDLSAQQRMTRDLQQDLMRVRMVPFSSVSERLYRVVRQSAKEVDKRVNLDIRGGGVEIDRSVLERMAAPFEHLLRNAIVHGVETRAERVAKGKSETGELLVEVRQEGNEIVLVFSDDGAGLNVPRIRQKARDTGLLGPDEELGDARVADLIFQPGFTTATEVTELAGRGVGMDVVRAEAGGLGGRVSVDSATDRGTRFTINLPLTLAVTQVVLVTVAARTYALPSVLVEQVQQVRPQPLAQAYNDGHVMWLNQPVKLYFLAGLLGEMDRSPIAQRYSPLLILRSGGDRVAVHVDEVVGNQEVVVKNIGPQLARMSGIAGATVLGSGDIVLILNPVQLAQQVERDRVQPVVAEPQIGGAVAELITPEPVRPRSEPVTGLETLPTVMVVDDSLTVRRVTQRLLTREGYQVVLAKDGVDALQQLQDYTPDVMLVDIEMPRMDGFDLTRNVRGDERYANIPIIMITSRTADKHREFALELGVNVYLGKPYQEEELLGYLANFTGGKRRAIA